MTIALASSLAAPKKDVPFQGDKGDIISADSHCIMLDTGRIYIFSPHSNKRFS